MKRKPKANVERVHTEIAGAGDDPSLSLAELIQLAKSGNTLAAREVAESLAFSVFASRARPIGKIDKGTPPPIPFAAADYLIEALRRVAAGQDANAAFNVKDKGRRAVYPPHAKRLAVGIMEQFVADGDSIEVAAAEAAAAVNDRAERTAVDAAAYKTAHAQELAVSDHVGAMATVSVWLVFADRPLHVNTLQSWYYEVHGKPKKKRIRKRVR